MRNFFLLLVLVNLFLLAWHYWVVESNRLPSAASQSGVPGPELVEPRPAAPPEPVPAEEDDEAEPPMLAETESEPEATEPEVGQEAIDVPQSEATLVALAVPGPILEAPQPQPEPEPEPAPPPEPDPQCMSLGSFSALAHAAKAAARLRERGLETSQRIADGQVWVGFWVYLKPPASRKEADAIVSALKEEKVSDLYIVPSGDSRNAVSLGVFSERGRAERRAARIAALGYVPVITGRYRSGSVYWIDFEIVDPTTINPNDYDTNPDPSRLVLLTCPRRG